MEFSALKALYRYFFPIYEKQTRTGSEEPNDFITKQRKLLCSLDFLPLTIQNAHFQQKALWSGRQTKLILHEFYAWKNSNYFPFLKELANKLASILEDRIDV